MENKKNKKKVYFLVLIGLIVVVLILISSAYAFYTINSSETKTNTRASINLECLEIEYIEEDKITTQNYPVKDEYALSDNHTLPVKVRIINKCVNNTEDLNYALVLTTLSDTENNTDNNNITSDKIRVYSKRSLNNNTPVSDTSALTYDEFLNPSYLDSLSLLSNEYSLNSLNEDIASREGFQDYKVLDSRIIDENFIANSKENVYEIKIWIDYYEGDKEAYNGSEHNSEYDNSTAGKSYIGTLSVIANPYEKYDPSTLANLNYLKRKDTLNQLTTDLVGGMYRYQGDVVTVGEDGNSVDVNNYICLGLSCDTEEINEEDMYRIIGITQDWQIKVIKKTAMKDDETKSFEWHTTSSTDTKWPDSDLFHRLNDNSSGTYSTTSFYSKLDASVKERIDDKHLWNYGDTNDTNQYNGDFYYGIETGTADASHRIKNANDNNYTTETYKWNTSNSDPKKEAPIGLMYIHDYLYAYPDGKTDSYSNLKNSWIFLGNNDDNIYSTSWYEWIMTRSGYSSSGFYYARRVDNYGDVSSHSLAVKSAVRPVFYLKPDIELTGEGTLETPFMIK